jgi:hypothetical protein
MDPKRVGFSPYVGMGNNPINFGDPDGRDIILLNSSTSVLHQGHIGILIGNDKDGWRYISKNGTKNGGPLGKSYNPDLGDQAYDFGTGTGNDFRGKGLNSQQVMVLVNEYHVDVNGGEAYDNYIRVKSDTQQDELAYSAAVDQAKSWYDGLSQSCLHVATEACWAIGYKQRTIFDKTYNDRGASIPNNWFKNFGWHNNNGRYFHVPKPSKPMIIVEPIQGGEVVD